ncbi:MAG: Rrf2 family transcriptional regulator [Phycisphaeraceae bacterium]|nr:Rrf2 family transcriptional regulator [Phycisphaeraceae bacterium]
MKLLSDAAEYALRAVIWMAREPSTPRKVRDIAQATHAASGYLVKVLQGLARAGILSARRGSQGGFTLRRDPAELTVLEVIQAIDPIERLRACPLGIEAHGACLCPMHQQIDDALAMIQQRFAQSTIRDLLDRHTTGQLRCAALMIDTGSTQASQGDSMCPNT